MPSQFLGLNIASSGLRNSNVNLNTTTNNITNINTKGYSKQKVEQKASPALSVYERYGCVGTGVETTSINRIRDGFYDRKYRENEIKLGENETLNYYNKILEDYFNDNSKTGFNTIFNNFRNGIETVISQGDTESKISFISDSKQLCEYFNDTYSSLQKLQQDINDEIKICVDSINSDIKKITELNKQINLIEVRGQEASELRDQRDLIVDELSKKINVKVDETKVIDSNNKERETGLTRFRLYIGNSINVIDGEEYKSLKCEQREYKMHESDANDLFDVAVYNKNNVSILSKDALNYNTVGGKLQGLFQMRDGNNNTSFNANIKSVSNNELTLDISSKDQYLYSNIPKAGNVKVNGKYYEYEIKSFNNTDLVLKVNDFDGTINQNAEIISKCDYQGIPYYQSQMNEWTKKFTDNINEITRSGYSSNSEKGINLFTIKNDTYSIENINAGNICINEELLQDASKLSTKSDLTEGQSEFKNLLKINDFLDNKIFFYGSKSGDFLTKMLSNIVTNSNNSQTLENMYSSIEKTIQDRRTSISGVDEDEEAYNLIKYQNAYMLNSKAIQVFSEIYNRLILETGV